MNMSKKIIWVEDDYDTIEPVIFPLRKAGYQITNIPNIKEAIEKIEELRNADLILLDLFFPSGKDRTNVGAYPGLTLLQKIRYEHKITTPVVVFTVSVNETVMSNFRDLGVSDIVTKPVHSVVLTERIEEVLKKHSNEKDINERFKDSSKVIYLDDFTSDKQLEFKIDKDMQRQVDPRTVFVVHGRNSKARKALFQFLRSIGLYPLEWSQAVEKTSKASPYVGEVLDAAFSVAQAAIILFTPDDVAMLQEPYRGEKEADYETELTGQARPNVIFEAGMAMGKFPDRTILVELGELRPISDISGRHVVKLNNTVAKRQELANRLKTAGCLVDLLGTDWHEDGHFEIPALNNTQFNKKEAFQIKSSKPIEPNQIGIEILKILSQESDSIAFEDIENETQIKPLVLRHNLDDLIESGFIEGNQYVGFYSLTRKGREFVINNDLI